MSVGFREVGALPSPSRSEPVSSSSALATTEAGGGWLASLGRPSEWGTALPLPKATAGGGTPSNRYRCHASLAGVPGPRPCVRTPSRREWGGMPRGRGWHTRLHVRRSQCGEGGPAGGPCLGGHGEGLGAASGAAASALQPPGRARPISQRRVWGLGRGARPGPPAHTQQRASDAGPAPRTASASGLGGEEAAPR